MIPLAGMLNLVKGKVLEFASPDQHELVEDLFRDNRWVRLAELIAAGEIRADPRHRSAVREGMTEIEAMAVKDRNDSWEEAMRYGLVNGIATLMYWYALHTVLSVFDLNTRTFPPLPEQT